MPVSKSDAIKNFLGVKTHADLSSLYHLGMECQVNVAQDGGERVEGDYKGRQWHGWTDGVTVWKSFRIPWNANTEPSYTDANIKFDLELHAEGIGMTGWDWQERVSRWVAYDFDAIVGHSDKHAKKLTNEQLLEVQETALRIPWVTVRKSTSGKGLHLYVTVDKIPTANHTEHQALARSILGMMSALTGFDFVSKVDICGGNMWVWHRKMLGTDGLNLVKLGEFLEDVPKNWRDHVSVITKRRRKNLPQEVIDAGKDEDFMELSGQRPYIPLDPEHRKLIEWLRENKALWWWEQDHHMLVSHTFWLKKAFDELGFKGIYETTSKGSNLNEQNCFAFPLRKGAWVLRRYSQGASEHDCWDQDSNGWTRCFYNRPPDLATACRAFGGMEDPAGGFIFRTATDAAMAVEKMGVILDIGRVQAGRKTKIKQHKDKKRIVVELQHEGHDAGEEMSGWLLKKKEWTKIETPNTPNATEPDDVGNYDDFVRHIVTPNDADSGWMIRSNNRWRAEPLTHIKHALSFMGFNPGEVNQILGSAVFKAWRDVNKPFQPEYPGDREWNRNAAQLRFVPTQDKDKLVFPSWLKILDHCGQGLNDAIRKNKWCKKNAILTGADYLKCWIASVFQFPEEPLPYLFFYGPQNSGKSIFHEALNLLLTKGYKRADLALQNSSGFNGELQGGIICVIEETDMNRDKQAYNRIKDWVLSPEISIHIKGKTPFHAINTSHFIQCANDHTYCPIFAGDTRIVMCYVPPLNPVELIPKKKLRVLLEKEAPDFLADIMALDLPESPDRLHIPPIYTEDKHAAERLNQNPLERFLEEHCKAAPGYMIQFKQFHERFMEWIESDEVRNWGKIKTSRSLPPQYPKARVRQTCQVTIGNISWIDVEVEDKRPLVVDDGYLVPSDE